MRDWILNGAVFLALAGGFGWLATGGRIPWQREAERGPDWCGVHGIELSRDEECNPVLRRGGTVVTRLREPEPGECPNTLVQVTLARGVPEASGVVVHEVRSVAVTEGIRGVGETQWGPGKVARAAPRLSGVVTEVLGTLGQEVQRGDVLARIDAPDLAGAKAACVQAAAVEGLRRATHERIVSLIEKRLATGREEAEARTALEEARLETQKALLRLRTLGFSAEEALAVGAGSDLSPSMAVTAPMAGTVVAVSAVAGEAAAADGPLFTIAATDRMWVAVDVAESDLTRVAAGQRVVFFPDGIPGRRFAGKVTVIGAEVNDRTRMARVFAEVKNGDGLLKAAMFGSAEILAGDAEPRLVVPKEAVQNDGDCLLVFVTATPGVFQARRVETGAVYAGGYEITRGLVAGERIASAGAYLLKTEAMRGQMGAG